MSTISSAVLAEPTMVFGPGVAPQRLSLGDSSLEGPSVSSGSRDLSPAPCRDMEPVGLAFEGAQLDKK